MMMKYKGYFGEVTYDSEAKIFHGEVVGLRDIITFQGTSVKELEKAFHDSVNDYLNWCKERGEEPERSFSGTFNLRISPELHAKLVVQAKTQGLSLNSYVTETLKRAV